jgi:dihydrofolate reductase
MSAIKIILIAAMDANGVIGVNNQIPWHCPTDLRHFRDLTIGRVVLMGRRTADSLKKPLRDRYNLVLTHDRTWARTGFHTVHTQRDIRRVMRRLKQSELWVIGGNTLYQKYLPRAHMVHLTTLQTQVEYTDQDTVTYFPVAGLRRFKGQYAQSTQDPAVVFWVLTPDDIQSGRSRPATAVIQ